VNIGVTATEKLKVIVAAHQVYAATIVLCGATPIRNYLHEVMSSQSWLISVSWKYDIDDRGETTLTDFKFTANDSWIYDTATAQVPDGPLAAWRSLHCDDDSDSTRIAVVNEVMALLSAECRLVLEDYPERSTGWSVTRI
jgi:hypothetical protein